MSLDLPENLLDEAHALLRFKSKSDTVVFALKEIVRRKRLEDLKRLMGFVDLRLDLAASRRRANRVRVESRKPPTSRKRR